MTENKNNELETLKKKLMSEKKNGIDKVSEDFMKKASEYCEGYKDFMRKGKIEREAVLYFENMAKDNGFSKFDKEKTYAAGDRIYYNNRNKSIILAVIGKEPVKNGVRIAAAHLDSPRLDLKPHPLYEQEDLAFFKTHYYGGVKKYQWGTIPLAIHGAIAKKDGTVVNVNIGEDENDPQFIVSDLLVHLANQQMKRTLADGIKGEELNLLVGSEPIKGEGADRVKLNVLKILNEKYGITEDDFLSAELEIVPAAKPVDIGFDRSMIGAYGHDDKVCSYPAATALFDLVKDGLIPDETCVTILTDKEEIGSDGNTGLNSAYFRYFISDLAQIFGEDYHRVLTNSKCLSADVTAAYDPTFADAFEKNNSSFLNYGVAIMKYTGHGGKYGASDASAEFMAKIRRVMDDGGVIWQDGELGKVDGGGGGTVAVYLAALDIDVVDIGVPVLSMHAPMEIVSKFDVYQSYLANIKFFKANKI